MAEVDLGIIHLYAVAGPDGEGRWCRGGRSAPSTGCTWPSEGPRRRRPPAARPSRGSGFPAVAALRRRQRLAEARHRRRFRQAQHEAAKAVIAWVGPAGSAPGRADLAASSASGRAAAEPAHPDPRIGHLITALADNPEAAGITCPGGRTRHLVYLPGLRQPRIPKPPGRFLTCRASSSPATAISPWLRISPAELAAASRWRSGQRHHRRAGAHLPGAAPSRRDPRRRAHRRGARESPGRHWPARAESHRAGPGSRSLSGEEPYTSRNYNASAPRTFCQVSGEGGGEWLVGLKGAAEGTGRPRMKGQHDLELRARAPGRGSSPAQGLSGLAADDTVQNAWARTARLTLVVSAPWRSGPPSRPSPRAVFEFAGSRAQCASGSPRGGRALPWGCPRGGGEPAARAHRFGWRSGEQPACREAAPASRATRRWAGPTLMVRKQPVMAAAGSCSVVLVPCLEVTCWILGAAWVMASWRRSAAGPG